MTSFAIRRLRFVTVAAICCAVAGLLTPSTTMAADQVFYYHNDAVGSPVAMTNASGAVTGVWQADYKPFGDLAASGGGATNSHQFTGKEVDPETGLQYFGARFYEQGLGRFVTVDPILLKGSSVSALAIPQRLNMYVYSTNNPYRFLDPDGKKVILASRYLAGGGLGRQHAFVVVEPDNPGLLPPQYRNRRRITLSAFPEHALPPFGNLIKAEDSDDISTAKWHRVIEPPAGMSGPEYDQLVLSRFNSYRDDLSYDLIPGFTGNYNSNSFAASLVADGQNVPSNEELGGTNPGIDQRFFFPLGNSGLNGLHPRPFSLMPRLNSLTPGPGHFPHNTYGTILQ